MGLRMALKKENNGLYCEFPGAYWCIDDIAMGKDGATDVMVHFFFSAYPSREAKQMAGETAELLPFGGGPSHFYQPVLYRWEGLFRATDIFPDGMLVTEAAQKEVMYPFVKAYLNLTEAEDILEEV